MSCCPVPASCVLLHPLCAGLTALVCVCLLSSSASLKRHQSACRCVTRYRPRVICVSGHRFHHGFRPCCWVAWAGLRWRRLEANKSDCFHCNDLRVEHTRASVHSTDPRWMFAGTGHGRSQGSAFRCTDRRGPRAVRQLRHGHRQLHASHASLRRSVIPAPRGAALLKSSAGKEVAQICG